MLLARRREGLVGALQDPLRADVDPAPCGHLPEHRQALGLEPAELVPGRPLGHEQRVRDQDARRAFVRAEDPDRLAALDEQRLVVAEPQQRPHDRLERVVRARRAARSHRRPRGPRAARRPRGRGCSAASAAAPRSATSARSAASRAARGSGRGRRTSASTAASSDGDAHRLLLREPLAEPPPGPGRRDDEVEDRKHDRAPRVAAGRPRDRGRSARRGRG